jgi:uncharacterized membrane protein YdjX (TVP38/TMEM64 family)
MARPQLRPRPPAESASRGRTRPQPARRGPAARRRTIFWSLVVLASLAVAYWQLRNLPSAGAGAHVQGIRDAVARWGPWAPVIGVLVVVAHLFIPLPGEIVIAMMGALFGFGTGLAVAWVGDMIGAVIAFEMGRAIGRNRQPRTVPAKALKWVDQHVRRDEWRTALVIRFVPLFPVNVFNFALGRTRVSWFTYLWTTALGFIPMTGALVAFGYGATGGREVLPWALLALAVMLIGGLFYRYRITQTQDGGASHPSLK